MSWKDKMDEWGGGDVTFLSEDGEVLIFIVVGEPFLLQGKFKGRISERIGCPIITSEGFSLFITGKRLARRLSRYENKFDDTAFMVVRKGEHNDIETTYELSVVFDMEIAAKLFAYKAEEFDESAIDDAVAAAQAIVTG